MIAAIAGSFHASRKAPARMAGDPETYPVRSKTERSHTGSKPWLRNVCTPRSNSSRLNGLAGDTMAMRSPDRSARGFSILDEPPHLFGDPLVLIAANHLPP